MPAPTTSGSVRRAAHEHVEPLVAGPVVGAQVDDVEAGAGERRPAARRGSSRRRTARRSRRPGTGPSPSPCIIVRCAGASTASAWCSSISAHGSRSRGHVQVARPRPRAAERAAPERQRLEVALDARYVGRGVAREVEHRRGGVERDRGRGRYGRCSPAPHPRSADHARRRAPSRRGATARSRNRASRASRHSAARSSYTATVSRSIAVVSPP